MRSTQQSRLVPNSTTVARFGLCRSASSTISLGVQGFGLSSRTDVDGRVFVPVVDATAFGADPLANGKRQLLDDVPAVVAPLAARVEAVHLAEESSMIFQAGISGYHILNRLKCRPPDNRPPEPEELLNCQPFLEEQLQVIKPRVVIALGRYAQAMFIEGDPLNIKVTQMAGKVLELPDYRVILTYHPSFVMRHRNREIQRFFGNHLRLAKQLEVQCPPSVLP